MSPATITLLFLLFAIVMFVWEKIPLGVTSMIICVGLVVTGVLDWKTAFAGFIDSNVILFVAMFIVGGALFETGMANKIGGVVTHFAKTERQLIIAIMIIVGLMSGVLSNTGTAAVLIPVVIGIAAKSGYSRSRLLMPLVFAAAMGGNLSLIGAPGNLIAQSVMEEMDMGFGFFEYAKVGLPILVCGIIYFAFFGYKLLPNKTGGTDSSYDEQKDFSNVPKWKQALSLIILILTLLGMIFEDQIGIKLCITGCIGALALILTGAISGPNSLTRQFQSVSGIPRSLHSARTISSTSVAATTAFPAGNTQWIALNSLHARSVFSFIPPFPMITLTPVSFTNSYSNFSIRMEVVGPTETISNLSFSNGRIIGPAWKIALFLTSTGISLPSSTTRRCATSRHVVMLPFK